MENIRALLELVRGDLPSSILRAALERHGDAERALAESSAGRAMSTDARRIDADLAWLAGPHRRLIAWHHADYPPLLRHGPCPPAAIFVEGDVRLLACAQVAIVGSRRPSAGGCDNARRFAAELADAGLAINSGLAEGIDTAAHEAALRRGRTIAVVATGLDLAYPASNAKLMRRIATEGVVLSEHPPGTSAIRQHFPSRNRLIAGLSLGILVVEAAQRSGALITARLAGDAGREVFALPGSIHNPMARGCHRLIREGATLVESPSEIVEALMPFAARLEQPLSAASDAIPASLTPDTKTQQRLWKALGHDPVTIDQLAARTGLTLACLAPMLLTMELDGRVQAEHGRYARRP
ncbi:DNA-processing protein DprA [Arenimonas sp.]|uniref:DNA-processing protein DprA n=1 Tax=Arenimonas sp. TaxID=1872635 RepID=UPI0039E70D86